MQGMELAGGQERNGIPQSIQVVFVSPPKRMGSIESPNAIPSLLVPHYTTAVRIA